MQAKSSAVLLTVATIALGITVAILGYVGSTAVGTVAFVGALVVGGLWAVRSIVLDRRRRSASSRDTV
jgi:MYXO-CTERM domain-containing protein